MRKKISQKGFTIIEAVVAAGVFAFVVSSALGVYLATMQLDSKSRAERAVLQNSRFIMDFLAKEIRNGNIDYSKTNDVDTLNLINQMDEPVTIDWGGISNPNLSLIKSGVGTSILNSDDVQITKAVFMLSPNTNPFDLSNDIHVQPHVTIALEIASTNPKYSSTSKINIQSTFAVRQYPSR